MLLVGGAIPRPIADDFNSAAGRLRAAAPSWTKGGDPTIQFGLDTYRSEANALAKNHGPAVAKFLGTKLNGQDPVSYGLALMTLAVLARDQGAAAELAGPLRDSGFRNPTSLIALTYAPAPAALAIADEAFELRDARPEALKVASTLFRFFGDAGRASALEKTLFRNPLPSSRDKTDAANLAALRQRLARPPAEQSAWTSQDLLIWKACRFSTSSHSLNHDLRLQVDGVCALRRFTPAFLKARLGASDIDTQELRLALLVAAHQPDPTLVLELSEIVNTRHVHWHYAKNALLAIRTRDALAPVERLITPPKIRQGSPQDPNHARIESDNRRELILSLCQELALCGDRATLDMMEALCTNAEYPAEERKAFVQARNALWQRLGVQNP